MQKPISQIQIAESIKGQLDGTIGSTSETQSDKTGFIDAGGISISDMGSMSNSMGGFGGNQGAMNGNMPQKPEDSQNSQAAQTQPNVNIQVNGVASQSIVLANSYSCIIVSIVVLLLGMGTACFYKRRK